MTSWSDSTFSELPGSAISALCHPLTGQAFFTLVVRINGKTIKMADQTAIGLSVFPHKLSSVSK